jgi:hypothetical protein
VLGSWAAGRACHGRGSLTPTVRGSPAESGAAGMAWAAVDGSLVVGQVTAGQRRGCSTQGALMGAAANSALKLTRQRDRLSG